MKAFVHGNPETAAVWGPLLDALAARGVGPIVTLSPPGFGAPLPDEFDASADAYAAWLTGEVDAMVDAHGGPIDLLGHDWGSGHVARVAADRPDLLRSWAIDVPGLLHPDYEWHDAARTWQERGTGEAAVESMVAMSAVERTELFVGLGLPDAIATAFANAVDAAMGRAILALYRSAAQPYLRDLGARVPTGLPTLVVVAEHDAYVDATFGHEMAVRLGAEVLSLDAGHWWMVSHPLGAAARLAEFWAALDAG